ncbi:uncharacterized protein BROUX77_006493 [Berkeleyomyces rouxiae]|uniref:uncharacterized protein n=1 Tax=Berkeleyomyces rouxiae TaxID=2035830 RepID=UPI003B78EE7B
MTTIEGAPADSDATEKRRDLKKLDEERFAKECKRLKDDLEGLTADDPETIEGGPQGYADKLAEALTVGLQRAVEVCAPEVRPNKRGVPWWDDRCKEAAKVHRRARRRWKQAMRSGGARPEIAEQRNLAKKKLCKEARRAKKNYYAKEIREINDTRKIFEAANWAHKQAKQRTPPLKKPNGEMLSDTRDKCELLLDVHAPTRREDDEALGPLDEDGRRVWDPPTEAEVLRAIKKPANTAPGMDGLRNDLWKKAWPHLKEAIVRLYQVALTHGVHPDIFKKTRMCPVPKPGRDRREPRAYRLISLLPTLGKGLERLVARRLAYEAVERDVIPKKYACAIPKRACSDLLLSLVDEIERGWEMKNAVSIATFDVKGAFDTVTPNRMVNRLQEEGWPIALCKWTRSFLQGRSAALAMDGHVTDTRQLGGSLPQGSPVSPILYMLFMAPLYSSLPGARGYADDGCVLWASPDLKTNAQGLALLLERADNWCRGNGLQLDQGKTGILHLTKKKQAGNPPVKLPDGNVMEATPQGSTLRWLGLELDRKLAFTQHRDKTIRKIETTASGLRLLAGCHKGAPPGLLLHVVRACAVSKLTYAAAAWWPMHKERKIATTAKLFDIALRKAIRAALPMYRTTPIGLLHRAAMIPPAEILLDSNARREATRLHNLDDAHLCKDWDTGNRIQTLSRLLPRTIPSPGGVRPAKERPDDPIEAKGDKDEEVARHLEDLRMAWPDTVWAYSDGAKVKDGGAGAGWTLVVDNTTCAEGSKPLGTWQEVADAEAIAALHAVQAAHELPQETTGDLYLCLDNRGIVNRLNAEEGDLGTSQTVIDETRRLLASWKLRQGGLFAPKARVRWVPGHKNIPGNERADRLARGVAGTEVGGLEMSLSRAKRWCREQAATEFKTWWGAQNGPSHIDKPEPVEPWKFKDYREHDRLDIGTLMAAISGHGDFVTYHQRFEHTGAAHDCPRCGQEKTPWHPWTCDSIPQRLRLTERLVKKLLPTVKGSKQLLKKLKRAREE